MVFDSIIRICILDKWFVSMKLCQQKGLKCHETARCVGIEYNGSISSYKCQCRYGFIGDGSYCKS